MSVPEAMPPPTLWARSLTVSRGGRTLFSNLNFSVGPTDLMLLLGPNGAGKTSLLLTLAGALRPAEGAVDYAEHGVSIPYASLVHLLPTQPAIKPRLSVRENLEFWRACNGPTGAATQAALARVGLEGLDDIEAGHLSSGQSQRLALARLLVSKRPIWLLDEPTRGLDAAGEAVLRDLVREHTAGSGMAVVATHAGRAVAGDRLATTLVLEGGKAAIGTLL
jgi:heme exporter protein A